MTPHNYCKSMLPKVSRTFALNIAILKGDLYKATLCSYLLCRILDTVEDTTFKNLEAQEQLLDSFKEMFLKEDFSEKTIQAWVEAFFAAARCRDEENEYYHLIRNTKLIVENFLTLSSASRDAIAQCIAEMASGMCKMVVRRERENSNLCFLKTIDDLHEYCYYVAGTVGILSTRLFLEYSDYFSRFTLQHMNKPAVSLALGLQITNIIKDCQRDYKRGVCYIPEEMLLSNGLDSENLFESNNREQIQNIVNALVERAANHLYKAMDSILSFPKRAFRIRLSCLWPLILAINTLIEVKDNPNLLSGKNVKVSRSRVGKLIRRTTILCWSNRALRKYFDGFRRHLVEDSA
ncbi:MAG: phytoene/squalene synthase family protein [bacterium]